MAQPEFIQPDFMHGSTEAEIHERMMANLPDDIDDMPGGFPYDFTMPAAIEKSEFINYHMARALMIAFPQYAWSAGTSSKTGSTARLRAYQNNRNSRSGDFSRYGILHTGNRQFSVA